jgi:hypothetical protein
MGLMHQIVDVVADWAETSKGLQSADDVRQRLELALMLDDALEEWKRGLPHFWTYERSDNPATGYPGWLWALLEQPGSPDVLHTYDSLPVVYGWNLYRMFRIVLNKMILANIVVLPSLDMHNQPPSRASERVLVINQLVEDICSSVHAHLSVPIPGKTESLIGSEICGLRTFLLASPLMLVSSCLRATVGNDDAQARADWVDHVLTYIRRIPHVNQ